MFRLLHNTVSLYLAYKSYNINFSSILFVASGLHGKKRENNLECSRQLEELAEPYSRLWSYLIWLSWWFCHVVLELEWTSDQIRVCTSTSLPYWSAGILPIIKCNSSGLFYSKRYWETELLNGLRSGIMFLFSWRKLDF